MRRSPLLLLVLVAGCDVFEDDEIVVPLQNRVAAVEQVKCEDQDPEPTTVAITTQLNGETDRRSVSVAGSWRDIITMRSGDRMTVIASVRCQLSEHVVRAGDFEERQFGPGTVGVEWVEP